jgi:hypothetical protein
MDPELDVFGNSTIRNCQIFVWFARVLQPVIPMLSEGLFSAYDEFLKELSFHMICHGRYDTGKSFAAIRTLVDFSTIPGTVIERTMRTPASDTTNKQTYDTIEACDEAARYLTSKAEADKNPELVDKEKVKMTRGQVTKTRCVNVKLPDGRSAYWAEDSVSDCKNAKIYVTNASVEEKVALTSRMFRMTVKQSSTPANELTGEKGATMVADASLYMKILQFVSAGVRKMAQVGAVLPDVELTLFESISNRVISYLQMHKHISSDMGSRSLDIMRPFVRQLVIRNAGHMAFDMLFSPNYNKKFQAADFREMQPYLYVTVSMVWWAWTVCASEWINDDNSNVVNAMCKLARIDWGPKDTTYDHYERDKENKLPFRMHANSNYKEPDPPGDAKLIDLQYLVLTGTEDQLCRQIAATTEPRMGVDEVKSVLARLEEHLVPLPHGGYALQESQTFADWHKYEILPNDLTGQPGVKKLQDNTFICPKKFNPFDNDPTKEFRKEDDVPKMGGESITRPVVDRCDIGKRMLYFRPDTAAFFKQNVITKALQYATCSPFFPTGKMLEGFVDPHDLTRFSVFVATKSTIENTVRAIDLKQGWEVGKDGKLVFNKPSVPEDGRPIPRREGIVFNHRAGLPEEDAQIATCKPLAPQKEGDDTWQTRYQSDAKTMSKTFEVIQDLDAYSARRQHTRCGRPLDEPVRTPQWIRAEHERACREASEKTKRHVKPYEDLDYPEENMRSKKRLTDMWKAYNGTEDVQHEIDFMFEESHRISRMSRAQRNALESRAKQQAINMRRLAEEHARPNLSSSSSQNKRTLLDEVMEENDLNDRPNKRARK